MIYSKPVKFILFYLLLVYLSTIRLNYQLDVNNYLYWKVGNFLVDNRYNCFLLSLFFLLKNGYLKLFFFFILDEFSWFDLNVTNSIKSFGTLTNGFFVIHPLIILLSFSIFISVLIYNKEFLYNIKINNSKKKLSTLLSLLLLGMFLGAYWANQEVGWGGWWSWDYVENINLILFLFILLSIHKKNINKNINSLYNKYYLMLFIIFLHLCVRLDLGDSIHSFIQTNEIEYVYLIVLTLNIFIVLNLIQNLRSNNINIINISYIFIILLIILLSVWYLLYLQSYNHKIIFICVFMVVIIFLSTRDNGFINYLIFDFYFFLLISLFKTFNKSKNIWVSFTHFIFFISIVILSINYLELTIYYTKKNTTIQNIINVGDFLYHKKIENFNFSYINWYNSNNLTSNWNFFIFNEIFFYKYLYEFKGVLTSDNIFLSYSNDSFQIYIYLVYMFIFLIKNTSIHYKYKRLCI